jgi:hypothetical protein
MTGIMVALLYSDRVCSPIGFSAAIDAPAPQYHDTRIGR